MEHKEFVITAEEKGKRLDVYLAAASMFREAMRSSSSKEKTLL